MLIAHSGDPVSIDGIIEAVWGEDTPSTARRNTQTYVSTLRGVIGEVIEKTSQGWRLVADRTHIDSLVFEYLFMSAAASVGLPHSRRNPVRLIPVREICHTGLVP